MWIVRRKEIAKIYDDAFNGLPQIQPLYVRHEVSHAYRIYVIKLNLEKLEGVQYINTGS